MKRREEREGITEKLKSDSKMVWGSRMSTLREMVTEQSTMRSFSYEKADIVDRMVLKCENTLAFARVTCIFVLSKQKRSCSKKSFPEDFTK